MWYEALIRMYFYIYFFSSYTFLWLIKKPKIYILSLWHSLKASMAIKMDIFLSHTPTLGLFWMKIEKLCVLLDYQISLLSKMTSKHGHYKFIHYIQWELKRKLQSKEQKKIYRHVVHFFNDWTFQLDFCYVKWDRVEINDKQRKSFA